MTYYIFCVGAKTKFNDCFILGVKNSRTSIRNKIITYLKKANKMAQSF